MHKGPTLPMRNGYNFGDLDFIKAVEDVLVAKSNSTSQLNCSKTFLSGVPESIQETLELK